LWDFRGCSDLTLTSPIRSGPLRDLDASGGKTGRVEDLVGEGRKPDVDDDDAPIHSVLGVEG